MNNFDEKILEIEGLVSADAFGDHTVKVSWLFLEAKQLKARVDKVEEWAAKHCDVTVCPKP